MKSAPSAAFRRLCLAMALLAASWVRPARVQADAYPLHTELVTANALRPNVLIVLETVETMQGLPGENQARYNEVGSDCEEGSRQCRLVGQTGRWQYTGMGGHGISFGDPNAICTSTVTNTITNTMTETQTDSNTGTNTRSGTGTETGTQTDTNTGTGTTTGTGSNTVTSTNTGTETGTNTNTQTATDTATDTNTGTTTATNSNTETGTNTGTKTDTAATATATNTDTRTKTTPGTSTTTTTSTATHTFSVTRTSNSTASWAFTGTGTVQWGVQATDTGTSITTSNASWNGSTSTVTGTANMTTSTLTATDTDGSGRTVTYTGSLSATWTASWTQTPINNLPATYTRTSTAGVAGNVTGTATITTTGNGRTIAGTWTGRATFAQTTTVTGVSTSPKTDTVTETWTTTQTNTTTVTATGTNTVTNTRTDTQTNTNTQTVTNTSTITNTGTNTVTNTATTTTTITSTGTNTQTNTQTNTSSATTTNTSTATDTITVTNTSSWTATGTETGTGTNTHQYPCGTEGSTDLTNCDPATPTTTGFCSVASGVVCTSEDQCTDVQGDFCRYISANDDSGRRYNEPCATSSGTPWGSCKHGVVTANTSCSSAGDTSCASALSGDYCAEGQPAKMCADSGLWCAGASDCPGDATTDTCSGATSRMMTVKRALRRAMSEYTDKVSFGFMSSYQGKGIGATNASTEIFPYVQLQSCPTSRNITETKFISRGELEKAGCFSLTDGPSDSCTIDYGGNGALNSDPALNQITYDLVGTGDCAGSDDSRWEIRRADGSGKSNHEDGTWSGCSTSAPLCEFSGGTGLYEGSYYCFKYEQGTPIASGEGSMAQPKYFTSYKGKFYDAGGGVCYNAIDAQRSDTINDNVFGRPAYTGQSWSAENEIQVPWGGANSAGACDATNGAIWHSNVVPFLTDTTFGGKSITAAQKTLMMTARLEKASFGGLAATGTVEPIACALKNDAYPDRYHSAADYMTGTDGVQSKDIANNENKTPCWNNGIILVVDGQPNGPGDIGASVHCASEACAHSESATLFQNCACPAIVKAYALAHSSTPVQTHVVVNAPNSANDSLSWSERYEYSHGFLTNLAKAGSPNFDGTPSFGTTEDEVYRAISEKIAAIAYHFTYTTTVPAAGATTQEPDTKVLSYSNYLYDAGTSYPSWKGTVRAYDTTSGPTLRWDAATVAAAGYPANWTYRRVYFSNTSGEVRKVEISSHDAATATISNASDLHDAGLGASSDEANKIMQWLLGKPGLGNPTPLMGSVTSSTPIVVGQGAVNGLNGSAQYSRATWKRPPLVYVGADDGMLHAFFAHLGSATLNGSTYQGGEEAFAFIPNDMLPVITKLYVQGGQKLPVDKSEHIFGLASSPKIKDMCIGTACESSTGSDWHTVLVMPEGPGGNHPFMLDITNVIDATAGLHPENMSLLWSVAAPSTPSGSVGGPPEASDVTSWHHLGETTSVPGFYFAGYSPSTGADNRVVFTSGYPVSASSSHQGLYLVNANAANGAVKEARDVSTISVPTSCGQTRTFMADVALARDFSSEITSQYLIAGYVADTWGNTFQYVPGTSTDPYAPGVSSDPTKVLNLLDSRGCDQPIHFAPALVQLDRAPKVPTSAKRFIYLVQVTNSNLDPDTMTNGHGSQMVVTKLDGNVNPPAIVTSYNPYDSHGRGQIVLSTDSTETGMQICIQSSNNTSFADGMKSRGQTCAQAGGQALPATARPVGTPTSVLRGDGLGFQVITGWFDPSTRANDCSSGKQYNYGTSYVTVHEFGADGASWFQIAGVTLSNTVLTGVAFVATGLFVDGLTTGSAPQSLNNIGETFSTMQQILNNATQDRYSRRAWTEFGL